MDTRKIFCHETLFSKASQKVKRDLLVTLVRSKGSVNGTKRSVYNTVQVSPPRILEF
jgi:hypothetical protein